MCACDIRLLVTKISTQTGCILRCNGLWFKTEKIEKYAEYSRFHGGGLWLARDTLVPPGTRSVSLVTVGTNTSVVAVRRLERDFEGISFELVVENPGIMTLCWKGPRRKAFSVEFKVSIILRVYRYSRIKTRQVHKYHWNLYKTWMGK